MQVEVIRGTNKIGGCITKITSKNGYSIIIDYGEDLEEDNKNKDFPIKGLTDGKSNIEAVFITHIHKDHVGLINNINADIDVYIEKTALKILQVSNDFLGIDIKHKIKTFKFKEQIKIQDMVIIPYQNDHSAYNSAMFLIQNANKKILHLGDFRLGGYSKDIFLNNLKDIGQVDLLITEGTNITRESKTLKEEELTLKALDIFKSYKQVFILQASTNIDRLKSFYIASKQTNKNFIVDLATANIIKVLNDKDFNLDNKDIKIWFPNAYLKNNFYLNKDINFKDKYVEPFKNLSNKKNNNVHKEYVMIVKTSMLSDIKNNLKKYRDKACLIYSLWTGYKDIKRQNNLKMQQFIRDLDKMHIKEIDLHASGHADRETLKLINDIIRPKKTIGIHTTYNQNLLQVFDNFIIINDREILKV